MRRKLAAFTLALALAALGCVSAFATGSGGDASAVMATLTTGLTEAQGQAMQGISSALPLALGIAGVILAVNIGYRIFKRMGKG